MDKRTLSIMQNNKWVMDLESFKALQTSVKMTDNSIFETQLTVEDPCYNIINECAIIPIKGIISKNVSDIEKIFFDIIDINDINDMFSKACKDNMVKSIVLDICSPGGNASGIPEMYDRLCNCCKPVISYVDEQCCSGAYWMAAASSAIYCTKSSDLGSIGCFTSIMDCSEYFKNAGFKNQVIISTGSKFKAAGLPGTSLTLEQTAEIQSGVDYISNMFKGDVTKNRKMDPNDMMGQTFTGKQAVDNGYADSLVDMIDTAIMDSRSLC